MRARITTLAAAFVARSVAVALTAIPAAAVVGTFGMIGAIAYAVSIGPGYTDNVTNQSCPDAGALIVPDDADEAYYVEANCTDTTYFGHELVVPVDGIGDTSYAGRNPSIRCRSQTNAVCDFRFLTRQNPDATEKEREDQGGLFVRLVDRLLSFLSG